MSSYWTIRWLPTTTIWRILRGASQESWTLAWAPPSKRRVRKAVSWTPSWKTLRPLARDLDQRLAEPVQQDREVVRGEVEDDAVLLVEAEVHARGGDEVDLAELVALDQVADLVDRGAVEEGVAGHQHQAALLGERDQLRRLLGGAGQRLLDQHVLAGFQGAADEREVGVGRGGDRHGLDPRVGQRGVEVALDPDAGMTAAEVFDPALVELAEAHQAELGPLDHVADDVRAPVAVADDHRSDRTCWVHAAPLLASTVIGVRTRIERSSGRERLSA